ncbi:MAG: aminoacyl-tRNA hydrolase [Actinobacteria bacterium]|jgi:ribosome-associated protein|nr:aminoacyl-tRNA hydrolase [Actinomycetota bacterium]MCL5445460.1 aminoacyl-tRNA hydrolase [Actinomycetota bacterium]
MEAEEVVTTKEGLRLAPVALTWRFSKSSGPGGQHVNTSDTRVELICDLSLLEGPEHLVKRVRARLGDELRVRVSKSRSQLTNRTEARRLAALRIEAATHVRRSRRATSPSRGSVESRLKKKRENALKKESRRPPPLD